jgi:hypothetical protein
MGDSDLTDGIWVWPQGLEHYVRHHHIRLPGQFIQTMRDSGWRVRDASALPRLVVQPEGSSISQVTYDFWINWARGSTP